jgi:hypothetical protein
MSTNYQEKVKRIRSTALVGYWPLDETSGTVALDHSTNGYNGTSSGLVRVPATRGFLAPDGGRCAQFDGSSSYVDINAASSSSANAELTFAIWVAVPEAQLSGTTKMQVALCAADSANQIGIDFDTTAQRFSGDYFAGAGDATYSTTTGALVYNDYWSKGYPEWHHLAITVSATADEAILYVDGSASTAASSLGTWTGAFGSTITCLGTSKLAGADQFTGWMAHAAWWSTPLTQSEIEELYKIGP